MLTKHQDATLEHMRHRDRSRQWQPSCHQVPGDYRHLYQLHRCPAVDGLA